ncbi:MAG: Gfo/Idh/MocA family oxidoreductase [Armatimonadetes bacterium]|nr:Gfo/Idh/MocA family oxidoreductase [Armatimonadota bacterium]
MEDRKLCWGIIGCSNITERRAAPAIRDQPNSALHAFLSRSPARAREFAQTYGASCAYDDPDAFFADERIDAVYIGTELYRHCEDTLRAAEHGKHVLCEKPMAMDPPECQRMIDACQANGVALAIAYYRRYYPKALKMKALIEAGAIGQPVMAHLAMGGPFDPSPDHPQAWRVVSAKGGGGALQDVGSHKLDLFCLLLGSPVEASGFTQHLVHGYEAPDGESAVVQFDSGAHAVLTCNWNLGVSADQFDIYGSRGALLASPFESDTLVLRSLAGQEEFHLPKDPNPHLPLFDDFTRRVLSGEPPAHPGEEGMKTTQVIAAVYESARAGRTVSIGPPASSEPTPGANAAR